jgi:hypothetical protein
MVLLLTRLSEEMINQRKVGLFAVYMQGTRFFGNSIPLHQAIQYAFVLPDIVLSEIPS